MQPELTTSSNMSLSEASNDVDLNITGNTRRGVSSRSTDNKEVLHVYYIDLYEEYNDIR